MKTNSNKWAENTKKNTRQLAYWTLGWVGTLAIASFGPRFLWEHNGKISILMIAINAIIGVGMILMNRKYLNGLDEMHRKVSLDAMAIALGVGLVGGISYSVLDQTDIIEISAEIAHLLILMGLTYIVAIVVGNLRYR